MYIQGNSRIIAHSFSGYRGDANDFIKSDESTCSIIQGSASAGCYTAGRVQVCQARAPEIRRVFEKGCN